MTNASTSSADKHTNPIVDGCTIIKSASVGISISGNLTGRNTFNGIVQNCTVTDSGWGVAQAGIYSHSTTGTIFRDNTVTDQIAFANEGAGFMFDVNCLLPQMYNCITSGNDGPGIITGNANTDAQIHHNVIFNCGKVAGLSQNQGIRIGGNNANTNANIYNNTVYDCETGIAASTNIHTGYTIKDNIISQSIQWDIAAFPATGVTIDNNCIYNTVAAGGTFMRWDSSTKNWADWLSASSQSTNSVNADPKFIDTTNFHLGSNSPCLGIGRFNEEYPLGRNRYNKFGARRLP